MAVVDYRCHGNQMSWTVRSADTLRYYIIHGPEWDRYMRVYVYI